MKIILREHVEHLGERGDEVNVAAGYARNYLLPKGLAYPAGAGSARQIEDQRRAWASRESRNENAAQELANMIGKLELEVRRRAGDRGTLYGSVTNADIAELLAQAGFDIDRRKIQIAEPIKSLGNFDLSIKLHRNVTASFKLTVLTVAGKTLAEVEAERAALEAEMPDPDEDEDDRGRGRGRRKPRGDDAPAAEASEEAPAAAEADAAETTGEGED